MSDKSGASLFSNVFQHLAEIPDERNKNFAKYLWSQMGDYDFDNYQLYCDEALIALDLAEEIDNPEYGQNNGYGVDNRKKIILFGPPDYREYRG